MIGIIFASALLSAQAGTPMLVGPFALAEAANERTDAAYDQLANGEAQAAIARLEAALSENPEDPALLINLGSAYTEIGDLARAETAYRAALSSPERYRLELAGGEWVDSRTAARRALNSLEERGFALR